MKYSNLKDEELIILYKKEGDNRCIEALFGRYIRFVIAVCMKYIKEEEQAKDIAMQVFEKSLEDFHRFEIKNFKSWIYQVSRNACLMHFRKEKSQSTVSLDDERFPKNIVESVPFMHHNEEGLNGELRLQQLEQAILNLDPGQKECIEMFYLKGKSYIEVVDATGFSINQVKSFIQNGKRNLKNHLLKAGNLELVLFIMCLTGCK